MAHPRKVIRQAVRQALEDAATAAATRVYATRVLSLRTSELPAIAVYTDDESSDDEESAPRELTRTLTLLVEGFVNAASDADDAMDDLAEEIETAMHADPVFGGVCGDSVLIGTQLDVDKVSDRLIGMVSMSYEVTYYSFAPVPAADGAMDDFERVEATHKVGGASMHDDDDAEDLFTVEAP